MKNKMLKIAFIAIALMAFTNISKAVTVCYYINLTDNCGGTWTGDYVIRMYVYYNDQLECSDQQTVSYLNMGNAITFSCSNLTVDSKNPAYEIKIEICRVTSPPCTCYGHAGSGLIHYDDLTSCNTTINVTTQ
jgi:hypothetical protein